jgi:hypothetical protein
MSVAPHDRLQRSRSVLAALAQMYSTERRITADGLGLEDMTAATCSTFSHHELTSSVGRRRFRAAFNEHKAEGLLGQRALLDPLT